MTVTLAFDVYGTLIDTHGLVSRLGGLVGDKAAQFSGIWRDKQLEYSFRRGLMHQYQTFAVCTRDALDYACSACGVTLSAQQKQDLLEGYRTLPAFGDAPPALEGLQAAGFPLYAFSNGSAEAIETLLVAAGIRQLFVDVVSVDEVRSFKPDPAVYQHFLARSGAAADAAWLVSCNPFDVIGAISAGMRAAWVRRSEEAIFDPWGTVPTLTVGSLMELETAIAGYRDEPS